MLLHFLMMKIPLCIKKRLLMCLLVNLVVGMTLGCSCNCYAEGRSSLLCVGILALVKYAIGFGLHNKLIVDFHQRNF